MAVSPSSRTRVSPRGVTSALRGRKSSATGSTERHAASHIGPAARRARDDSKVTVGAREPDVNAEGRLGAIAEQGDVEDAETSERQQGLVDDARSAQAQCHVVV